MPQLGELILDGLVLNASGARCSNEKSIDQLNESESAAIVSKSCTVIPLKGNPHPNYYSDNDVTINSIGLANPGFDVMCRSIDHSKLMKPFILSVAGNVSEMRFMYKCTISEFDWVSGIEFNLSCPNVCASIIGYDVEKLESLLIRIDEIKTKPYGLKLPPYLDYNLLKKVAKIVEAHNVDYIVCSNTMSGIVVDAKNAKMRIAPNDGVGGISGIKYIAQANVRMFSMLTNTAIVGCGGVRTGEDVHEYELCGASAVQLGCTLVDEGPKCFERINAEYEEFSKRFDSETQDKVRAKL